MALAGLAAIAGIAHAGPGDRQNNHTAAFLRVGVDARHLAMGGSGAALADNIAAGYWNPAGLAMMRGWSFTGMTTAKLNFDRRHNYFAGAWGGEQYAFALSWINAGTGDILATDVSGTPLGEFSFNENSIVASVAAQAGNANVGLSGKLITQSLGADAPEGGDDSVVGYGFDIGAQVLVTQFARLGIVIHDLFGQVGGTDTDNVNDIPSNFRVGLALEPMDGFTLTSDLEKPRDVKKYRFHAGLEYEAPLGNDIAGVVRLGIQDDDYSGGLGLAVGSLQFDYAYVIEREAFLDENHRFSLTLNFGTQRRLIREGNYADRDNDGIPDDLDECPDHPEDYDSYEDFDGCPDLDNDGDGIGDLDDLCPDEPEDPDGYEDNDGCPDPDNDGDGVADPDDQCPDEAETRNGYQDDDGCPDEASFSFPPAYLNFAPGSAELDRSGSYPVLDDVMTRLKSHPELRIEIQGHTDSEGSEDLNLRLSERRAQAVKQYFVERGIDPGHLRVRGVGESQPIAPNDTREGRARNRRIEFVRLSP
jgi:outer membrane protein OmpA-like peptidoglycan-associated protein